MPVLPFGEFLPDVPANRNPGVVVAINVYPDSSGYCPVKQWQSSTDALDARPRFALRARDFGGVGRSFAGNETKLSELVGSVWTDRSKAGGYATGAGERWEMVHWRNKILGVNYSNDPQQITMGGLNFSDLTTDFRARHIAVIRNQVIAGNTFDATDGAVTDRLRVSAFNDETSWTPDPATLADIIDLQSGGAIRGISGGEFGVVFQESAINRMTFVGSPTVFQIDQVLPGFGLLAPGGRARVGRIIYCLSTRGFIAVLDGSRVEPLGENKFDEFLLNDIDTDNLDRVSSVYDPESGRVLLGYPGSGNSGGRPNKILVYDTIRHRGAIIDMEHEFLWRGGGVSIDLDTDDPSNLPADTILDDVTISFDSSRYKGSGENIQAFDLNYQSGAFDSAVNMTAVIQTGEREISDGRNTRLNAFRPVTEGGTVTAEIGTRQRLNDAVSFSPSLNLNNGRFTKRANGRYHTFRLNLSGDWTHAAGIQIARGDAVAGERRA